jgi:hypothetical protein
MSRKVTLSLFFIAVALTAALSVSAQESTSPQTASAALRALPLERALGEPMAHATGGPAPLSVTCSTTCQEGQSGPLSCTGTTCSAGATWVECDGVRHDCQCEVAACTSNLLYTKPFACGNPWALCYQQTGCCICD